MILLPHSHENEMAVISSMVEDSDVIDKVSFLSRDDFYSMPHKLLFDLIVEQYSKGNNVDAQLISDLVTDDMGGIAYLADIIKANSSTKNAVAYAKKVMALSIRRKAMAGYQEAIEKLSDTRIDHIDSIAEASNLVDEQLSRSAIGEVLTVEKLIEYSLNEMDKSSRPDIRVGLSTGIKEIDDRLGYQNLAIGEITYLGAQSKNGKTLFGNTIAARADLQDNEVCHIFSIEMPAVGMFNGVVSAMSGVPSNFYARQDYYSQYYSNQYDEWFGRWGKAAQELNESGKITIDDKKDVTMKYICSEMRKQHSLLENQGKVLRMVVIDHLHRISFDTSKKSMTYAMGDDVRMLKNTAAELGIAVLLLGQLNENCKDRNPTAFDILDTSRVRHEIQCFIGTRIFRENGVTRFGIYCDAHRYADHETLFHPAYMRLAAGVLRSLPDNEKNWTPNQSESNQQQQ
ncbi:DnaB-like replicative helicase [Vibrio phage Seahorse]|uniref:DNA 5'-3' helicase n=1 Tax=Vibrio phage Seahorse TaxID=2662136 RepID=A0A6B7SE97_9CAUD|nr:DnaB-like replicative helicase [Vibrio phage Seahorse]QGF20980.1 DNA helicase [Vibrio phage Seahorse]